MKKYVDTYYDLTCSICAKSRSTDYEKGMATRKDMLLKYAGAEGWCCISNKVLCPDCARQRRKGLNT